MDTETYTEYDRQADTFLSNYRLSIHAELLSFELPEWLEDGHPIGQRYNVSITRLDDPPITIEFKFWSSYNDALADVRPSNYHILACVSSNAYAPIDADGVLSEYGDMERSQAEDVAKEAVRLQSFFNEEELRDLGEII